MIVELEPGRRFLERSSMLSLSSWQHERIVEPAPDVGATLTDRLSWQPRTGVPKAVTSTIVAANFRHRHARLREKLG